MDFLINESEGIDAQYFKNNFKSISVNFGIGVKEVSKGNIKKEFIIIAPNDNKKISGRLLCTIPRFELADYGIDTPAYIIQ